MQSNVRDDAHITAAAKCCQAIFSPLVKRRPETTFGERLILAYRNAGTPKNKSEIAENLGVGNSTVTGWMKAERGGSYPEVATILAISDKTKCNLHWLLTGEGEESADQLRFLDENLREIVQRIASEERRGIEEVINALVVEALAQRASEIFIHLNQTGRLTESERQQLALLYKLILDRTNAA